MKFRSYALSAILAGTTMASAQVVPLASSHGPARNAMAPAQTVKPVAAKPVLRVNGAVLTENDVLREMYAIFPYGQQHNGIPKDMEPQIRKGATDMLIFEELLYQEAKRRSMTIAPERITRAVAQVRKQYPTQQIYQQYLAIDCNGSEAVLKEKIRRSMLIERMLKSEVEAKAVVTPAAVKAYYDANSKQYERKESVSIQTISIIPPPNASAEQKAEAKGKITDIVRLGRAAKTYREFGMIAEQLSEDDWRTKLGDRGAIALSALPPEVVNGIMQLKPGQVSDAIALGPAWVVIRLNARNAAGKTPFAEVRDKLTSDLKKQKVQQVRAALNQSLRKNAKIEEL